MISEERRKWLGSNKVSGDIEKAVKIINPKNMPKGLSIETAYNIMAGRTWGKWGKVFTDTLEKIINNRIKALEKEAARYSKAV